MRVSFKFSDHLIFLILALNLYISTDLPGQFTLKNTIHFLQILITVVLLICTIRFENIVFNPFRISFAGLILLTIFAFFIFSSFVVNIGKNSDIRSLSKLATYPLIGYVFFVYLGKKLTASNELFQKYLRVFLYAGIISSVMSVIIFALGIYPGSTYANTMHGIFVHPNTTSFLYILVLPVLMYFYYSRKINLFTFTVILMLFVMVLLFTYSRAGYIGAFSAMAIFGFLRTKRKKTYILISVIAAFIAYLILQNFITAKADSSFGRALLIITAYNMIMQSAGSFLWGYGVFSGVEMFRDEKVLFGSQEFVDDPHNFILLSGIQFGIVLPLLALLFILWLYVKFFTANKNKIPETELLNIYLCISVTAGYLINNMLEDIIVYPEYYVMPVFLLFLGYLYHSLYPKRG